MLAPPPPDDTEIAANDNLNASDSADQPAGDNDSTSEGSPSEDVDSNGDTNATDNADTNGTDNADTNGTDADTSGLQDADTAGLDNADTDGGVPPLPEGATLSTTTSGLQFFDFELGRGAIPTELSTVRVAYTGYLEDGTIFDSNENATFSLSSLIQGFSEGVRTMNVGGRRRIIIPPELGYGAAGNPGAGIGGEDTIIFDVELLGIEEL